MIFLRDTVLLLLFLVPLVFSEYGNIICGLLHVARTLLSLPFSENIWQFVFLCHRWNISASLIPVSYAWCHWLPVRQYTEMSLDLWLQLESTALNNFSLAQFIISWDHPSKRLFLAAFRFYHSQKRLISAYLSDISSLAIPALPLHWPAAGLAPLGSQAMIGLDE